VAEFYIKFIELIDSCKKMIELILLTSIATTHLPLSNPVTTPASPPVTAALPKATFTPAPGESWSDKIWQRYKERSK
jgi:hypothetical protein